MDDQSRPHREQIKAAIRMAHGSMSAFEVKFGLPAGSAKDVLRGRTSIRTAEAIATVMKMPVHVLFPTPESTIADCDGAGDAAQRLMPTKF